MQILKPSSVRGATTTWRAIDPRTGNPLRIRRMIDIDGDEHWHVAILRGETWASLSKYTGLNRDTSQRIKRDFELCLYEVEDMPSPEPHTSRRKLWLTEMDERRHEPELPLDYWYADRLGDHR